MRHLDQGDMTTLWLCETESSELLSSFAPAPTSTSCVESYVLEDAPGGLVLCDAEHVARSWPMAMRLETLFADGRFGSWHGSFLFKVGIWAPAKFRGELREWYRQEHLPILLECPVWDGCRFTQEEVGEGCQFYALHQLSHPRALESKERARSRSTPWFLELKRNDWFDEPFTRVLYRRADESTDDAVEGTRGRRR